MDTYVGIRIESCKSKEDLLNRIKHNTRFKKDKSIKNSDGIITFQKVNGKLKAINITEINSKYSKNQTDLAFEYEKTLDKQSKLFYKNKKYGMNKKKARPYAEGVLYFSKGINEDYFNNPNEFHKKVVALMKDFEKTYNTKVINYVLHLDEIKKKTNNTEEVGNVHLQFIFENFDNNTGLTLNFEKDKQKGGELQDLAGKYFENFGRGFKRGEIKDKPSVHLTTQEYQELQEAKKLLKTTQEQLKSTQNQLETANQEIISLKDEKIKLEASINELKQLETEHIALIEQIANDLIDLSQTSLSTKFIELVHRYSKSDENQSKLQNLIKKYQKKLKSSQKSLNSRKP